MYTEPEVLPNCTALEEVCTGPARSLRRRTSKSSEDVACSESPELGGLVRRLGKLLEGLLHF